VGPWRTERARRSPLENRGRRSPICRSPPAVDALLLRFRIATADFDGSRHVVLGTEREVHRAAITATAGRVVTARHWRSLPCASVRPAGLATASPPWAAVALRQRRVEDGVTVRMADRRSNRADTPALRAVRF